MEIMQMLRKLKENDGATLKAGKLVSYKTGYQVATEGMECTTVQAAAAAIAAYNGTCGVWYSGGIYYIDKSHREKTLRDALRIGRECKQISILRWRDMELIYC